jgi:hypothetical protein
MADASTMLLQDSSILDFLKMMNGANRQSQASEYADFFASVDTMQNQLNETLAELKNVRRQLDAIQDRKNPIKRAFTSVVNKLQAEVQAIQEQLNALKEKLITAAKNAVQGFKEKGQAALNGVLKFFGIKQDLQDTVKSAAAVIESCNQAIAKIEAVSNEYHAVGLHTRNMGRAIAGKESVADQKPKGNLAKALQAIVRFRRNVSNGLKKKCEAALAKLESLEKSVQQNRDRAAEHKAVKKPSLMKRMEEHQKNDVPMQQAPDKSKKREESL